MSNRNSGSDSSIMPFLAGALVGGIIGAGVALLLAPKDGAAIRDTVGKRLDDALDVLSKTVNKGADAAEDLINEGKQQGERIVRDVRDRAENLIRDADSHIQSARDRLSSAIEDVID